ncbi:hypothetical protein [Thalassobellus citreus]|uniref:Cap15 family cyclic dinucleotide receptor domain-containing protein n=1 Tax=Thalassobellus citreus TaxID=3367752 RepID=UPI0037AFFFE0
MKPTFNFKYYKETSLILLIIILYILSESLIKFLDSLLESYDFEYHRFYPATILLAMIFGFINYHLHKIPFLWNLLIKVPLIRGKYEGFIYYTIDGVEMNKKCTAIINQTTSKIKINSRFWNEGKKKKVVVASETPSESLVEDFVLNASDVYELHFYYRNGGNHNSTIPIKEGYNVLKYNKKDKLLEGHYFSKNSITVGNGGKIKINYKGKI